MRVIDFFDKGCAINPDAAMFVTLGGEHISYAEMKLLSDRIASAISFCGDSQAHVAVYCHNDPIAFAPILGSWRSGGLWAPINTRNSLDFNVEFMNTVEVNWLFYHSKFLELVPEILSKVPTIKHVICLDRDEGRNLSLEHFLANNAKTEVPDIPECPDRLVAILPTGGTSGKSKGVALTDQVWETMTSTGWHIMPFDGRPVHLLSAPMTHAAGILALVLSPGGATSVVLDKVDPVQIMQAIEQYRVTHIFLPPTALYSLLAHPDVRKYDYSTLRYFLIAAAPVSPDKFKESVDVFGPCMCQCWAQAESPFFLTWLSPKEVYEAATQTHFAHRLKSCGRAVMLSKVAVIDDSGNIQSVGDKGELCMKGNLRMAGYYKDEVSTNEIRDTLGWQHTGDIGYQDQDGYFYIVDRKKDMIVSGGFNVFSIAVENALNAHPQVRDCAVYGIPDEKWGEAVHATVELRVGAVVESKELIAFARERLGGVKAPKSIDFTDSLPRSPVGKIMKHTLREKYWIGRNRKVG